MPLDLHAGDTWHSDEFDRDLEIVLVTDHTDDSIGRVIYEAADTDGWLYFVIEGVTIRGGVR